MHHSELKLYLTDEQESPDHFKHMIKKIVLCWNCRRRVGRSGRICLYIYIFICLYYIYIISFYIFYTILYYIYVIYYIHIFCIYILFITTHLYDYIFILVNMSFIF